VGLTPKGQKSFFSKKCSNLPFLAQEAKTKTKSFFRILIVGSCLRLLEEHVQKLSKNLTAQIVRLKHLKWEKIKFFACALQE
jgi:hypothetical protein